MITFVSVLLHQARLLMTYWPPGYLCGGQQRWQHRLTFRSSGRCLFKGKWAGSVVLTVIPPKKLEGTCWTGVELVPWKCDCSWLETKTVLSSISFFRLFLDTFTRFGRAFTSSTVSAHVGFLGGSESWDKVPGSNHPRWWLRTYGDLPCDLNPCRVWSLDGAVSWGRCHSSRDMRFLMDVVQTILMLQNLAFRTPSMEKQTFKNKNIIFVKALARLGTICGSI